MTNKDVKLVINSYYNKSGDKYTMFDVYKRVKKWKLFWKYWKYVPPFELVIYKQGHNQKFRYFQWPHVHQKEEASMLAWVKLYITELLINNPIIKYKGHDIIKVAYNMYEGHFSFDIVYVSLTSKKKYYDNVRVIGEDIQTILYEYKYGKTLQELKEKIDKVPTTKEILF